MTAAPQRVLSVIAPMTQLNTPYPSTAYLTGFLRSRGIEAAQVDLALALVLELFSPAGLHSVRDCILAVPADRRTQRAAAFDAAFDRYHTTIAPTLAFLQGRDPTLAHRIATRSFLPEGPRFDTLDVYVDPGDPSDRRRPAGLGFRRAGPAGPRTAPGDALPERPRRRAARRRRPALRVRALRRVAGHEPAELRAAWRRRWPRRPT